MSGFEVDRALSLLLLAGAKGALLLAVAALAATALGRTSAAARHWTWFLAMAGLLVLPPAGALVPGWAVGVPDGVARLLALESGRREGGAHSVVASNTFSRSPGREASLRFPGGAPPAIRLTAGGRGVSSTAGSAGADAFGVPPNTTSALPEPTASGTGLGSGAEPGSGSRGMPVSGDALGSGTALSSGDGLVREDARRSGLTLGSALGRPEGSTEAAPEARSATAPSLSALLVALWGAGVAWLLLALATGQAAVLRFERRSAPFPPGRVAGFARALSREMGIRRAVRVLQGPPEAMPMGWGLFRPVILLPSGAERWDDARLHAVLLHELAHVRRRDCLTQAVAELALALHWPNPLAWLAARRLRIEREHACDDAVVLAGARPSDYARELLALAASCRRVAVRPQAAVAMARPVHLAARLRAILDERRSRAWPTPGAVLAAGLAAVVVLGLAAFTPQQFQATPPGAVPGPVAGGGAGAIGEGNGDAPAPAAVAGPPAHAAPGVPDEAEAVRSGAATREDGPGPAHSRFPAPETCSLSGGRWSAGGGRWRGDSYASVRFSRAGCAVEAETEGRVTLSPDGGRVLWLPQDALGPPPFVQIIERDGDTERLVRFDGDGGRPVATYRVNGQERPFDAAADAWAQAMLAWIVGSTDFLATSHVAALLRERGVEAALGELDRLSGRAHAAHVRELLGVAYLSAAQVIELLERSLPSGARPPTGPAPRGLFDAVPSRHLAVPRVAELMIQGTLSFRLSDLARAGALLRVIQHSPPTPELVVGLLESTGEMRQERYLNEVFAALAARLTTDELRLSYLDAVVRLSRPEPATPINEALPRLTMGSGPAPTFVSGAAAAGGVRSDRFRPSALRHLLRQSPALSQPALAEVIRAAAGVTNDQDRFDLLSQIRSGQRLEGATMELFLEAMAATPAPLGDARPHIGSPAVWGRAGGRAGTSAGGN